MSDLTLSDVPAVSQRIAFDIQHRLALAIYATNGSWASAVVLAHSGEVLAWDGWYNDALSPEELEPVASLEWDDWDDMPSKLLLRRNEVWLGGQLAYWLMPTYSIARNAANLIVSHARSRDYPESAQQFADAALVAYFPLVDETLLLDTIADLEASSSFATPSRRNLVSEALKTSPAS